jgi:hypothetical protein
VRANIPDLVAASIMAILYACRLGKSMGSKKATGFKLQASGSKLKAEGGRQKAEGGRQKAEGGRRKSEVGTPARRDRAGTGKKPRTPARRDRLGTGKKPQTPARRDRLGTGKKPQTRTMGAAWPLLPTRLFYRAAYPK